MRNPRSKQTERDLKGDVKAQAAMKELDAMRTIVEALAGKDEGSQKRVLAAAAILTGVVDPDIVLNEIRRIDAEL